MRPDQVLVDAAAFRGELLDVLLAGMAVGVALAIACLVLELRRK